MGIVDSFRQLADRAKAKMSSTDRAIARDENLDAMTDKFDNTPGDRFDRMPEGTNERTDDFSGGRRPGRRNRDMG